MTLLIYYYSQRLYDWTNNPACCCGETWERHQRHFSKSVDSPPPLQPGRVVFGQSNTTSPYVSNILFLLFHHLSVNRQPFAFAAPPQLPFGLLQSPIPEHPTINSSGLSLSSRFSTSRWQKSGLPHLGAPPSATSLMSNPSSASVKSARISRRQSADRMNARTASGAPRSGRQKVRPYPGFGPNATPVEPTFGASSMDSEHDDRTCCIMIIPHQVQYICVIPPCFR
jgi:hypothetical protein